MKKVLSEISKLIQPALADWSVAVDALLQDIERIAEGGQLDPTETVQLIAALESARLRCEAALPLKAQGQTVPHDT